MPDIHFMRPDGTKEAFPEERIGELREQGALYSFTYFWKEGMPEWRPVQELTDGYVSYEQSTGRFFIRPVSGLTQTLLFLYKLMIGCTVLSLCLTLSEKFIRVNLGLPAYFYSILGIASSIMTIVILIELMRWVYFTNLNVRGFGAQGLKFSPGWAVGCFFIPIANIFLPYKMIVELWKASGVPHSWKEQKLPFQVTLWWCLRVSTRIMVYTLLVLSRITSGGRYSPMVLYNAVSFLTIALSITSIAGNFYVLYVIKNLHDRQKAWVDGR